MALKFDAFGKFEIMIAEDCEEVDGHPLTHIDATRACDFRRARAAEVEEMAIGSDQVSRDSFDEIFAVEAVPIEVVAEESEAIHGIALCLFRHRVRDRELALKEAGEDARSSGVAGCEE